MSEDFFGGPQILYLFEPFGGVGLRRLCRTRSRRQPALYSAINRERRGGPGRGTLTIRHGSN